MLLEVLNNAYRTGNKLLFVLIDPDHFQETEFLKLIQITNLSEIDAFLVGGSLLTGGNMEFTLKTIKKYTSVPVCIFPGNYRQIDKHADSILFMSLISGRNPEFLIGNQVVAAAILKQMSLEIIATGYMLIDSGKLTTAHYMSNTLPIPADKPEIAANTALAGQMLGMQCIYADAGSGAQQSLTPAYVNTICKEISIPLIVGGGIRNPETAKSLYRAGATALVIGNAVQQNPEILKEIIQSKY